MGLHAKSMEIGRRSSVIDPANVDPQSALINSEMFAVIDSDSLVGELAETIERHACPLQCIDVGAVVDVGGGQAMAASMAGQKHQLCAVEFAEQ